MRAPRPPGRPSAGTVPTGNTFDKYGSTNPVVRRLMAGFHGTLDDLWAPGRPRVGARRGLRRGRAHPRVGRAAGRRADRRASTSTTPSCSAEWASAGAPNLEYRVEEATALSFADGEFDVATAIEVLEHVPDPEATVAEMARVAERHLLVSVPREPLWRGLNMARGAYWGTLGNTPGHVNHWSKRSFVDVLSRHGDGRGGALALPLDDAARPALVSRGATDRRGYGRGAALLSVGIGATGLVTYGYFSLASHTLSEADYGGITLLWSAVFITVSVLYRPVEQLLSRTIADRDARGDAGQRAPARGGHDPARARASRSRSPRWRCAGRSRTTCSTARPRSTGS